MKDLKKKKQVIEPNLLYNLFILPITLKQSESDIFHYLF